MSGLWHCIGVCMSEIDYDVKKFYSFEVKSLNAKLFFKVFLIQYQIDWVYI